MGLRGVLAFGLAWLAAVLACMAFWAFVLP
jgi:hypothetical protein